MHLVDWAHRIDLTNEIQEIYLHRFLFQLAIGTVAIFVPLYLLEQGFLLSTVFLFYLVYYGTFIVAAFPAAHLTSRYGYKHVALLSAPFILTFYLLLRTLSSSGAPLYGIAALGGIGFVTYWIGMNSEMARNSHDADRDKETGYFFSMPMLGTVLSPFVGGLILSLYSFSVLFLVTVVLVGFSYLPFLLSREHYSGMETGLSTFFHRGYYIDFLTFMANGAASIGKKVLWPLFLAVVLEESLSIGGAGSLLALGSAITSIVIGTITDADKRDTVLSLGGLLVAGSFLLMTLVTDTYTALAVSFINGAAYVIATLPLYSKVMGAAEHEDIIGYFVFREVGLCTGRALTLIGLFTIFVTVNATVAFRYGLYGVALACVLLALVGRRLHH